MVTKNQLRQSDKEPCGDKIHDRSCGTQGEAWLSSADRFLQEKDERPLQPSLFERHIWQSRAPRDDRGLTRCRPS